MNPTVKYTLIAVGSYLVITRLVLPLGLVWWASRQLKEPPPQNSLLGYYPGLYRR